MFKVVLVFPGKNSLTLEEIASISSTIKQSTENHNDCIQNPGRSSSGNMENGSPCKNPKGNSHFSDEDKGGNLTAEEQDSTDLTLKQVSTKRKNEDTTTEDQKKQRTYLIDPPFERAVFIDSTWKQTKGIIADDRLKGTHDMLQLHFQITKSMTSCKPWLNYM